MTRTGAAQGNFEIQVYGAETVAPGDTMLELHGNAALQGTTHPVDGVRPIDHAVHETIEITHGFTSWFETGLYISPACSQIQAGSGLAVTSVRGFGRRRRGRCRSGYGGIGPLNRIDPVRTQQHLIFPVIDGDLGPRWEFNLGLGFGLTPSTDTYLIKMILGYRFDVPKAEFNVPKAGAGETDLRQRP